MTCFVGNVLCRVIARGSITFLLNTFMHTYIGAYMHTYTGTIHTSVCNSARVIRPGVFDRSPGATALLHSGRPLCISSAGATASTCPYRSRRLCASLVCLSRSAYRFIISQMSQRRLLRYIVFLAFFFISWCNDITQRSSMANQTRHMLSSTFLIHIHVL